MQDLLIYRLHGASFSFDWSIDFEWGVSRHRYHVLILSFIDHNLVVHFAVNVFAIHCSSCTLCGYCHLGS